MLSTYQVTSSGQKMRFFFKRLLYMGRVVPEIDPVVAQDINSGLNPKRLRTRRNMGFTRLPCLLEVAAEKRLADVSDKKLRSESTELIEIMKKMKLPDDKESLKRKKADIKTTLELRDKIKERPEYEPDTFVLAEEKFSARFDVNKAITGHLQSMRRDWHYYEYDEYASDLYMAVRLPPNYACIKTVMSEIKDLCPELQPKSVLDFGSGLGTTLWAVNEVWPNIVEEFMNVELSKHQQYLCEYLLRGAKDQGPAIPRVFHREYLPASTKVKYDIVVAAFTLLEVPNSESRAQIIENLWHKTNDLLVIIERGTKGGFSVVHDARHQVLDQTGHDVTSKIRLSIDNRVKPSLNIPSSHILAPCPHEYSCPRGHMTSKKRMDVCRFRVVYEPLEFGQRKTHLLREEFSYVVMRKKPHPSYTGQISNRWPRVVEKRKHSSKLITHRLCCPNGDLSEVCITAKKYGKESFELAKSCDWGDILPVKIKDTYVSKSSFIDEKTSDNGDSSSSSDDSDLLVNKSNLAEPS